MCLLPTASMKPHCLVNQLLCGLVLVDVVDLNEVLQDLQPRQEISWFLLCSAVQIHHVGFVLLDECIFSVLALHRWLSKHPHVLGQSLQLQRNHALSLMLLKGSELVVVGGGGVGGGGGGGGGGGVVVDDSVWQESMRSEVEHSWTVLFHLLVSSFTFIILAFLAFLSFSFSFSFLLEISILI